MTLTSTITTGYAFPALEKNSVGFGDSVCIRRTPAIRAVFLCPQQHGKSFMGDRAGILRDCRVPDTPVRQPARFCPPCLATGGRFQNLYQEAIMSKSITTSVVPFTFEKFPVRAINRNGDIWFVAADVCAVLNIKNTSQALETLDDDERSMFNIGRSTINGGGGVANIINESGLYSLILRSRKTEAKRFRKWVTSEVLPSIRKTGSYSKKTGINPRDLMLTGQAELKGKLPHVVERAVHRKASKMAFEAYELSVEHLKRRLAYYVQEGVTHEIDEHRAMQVIASCNLGNALAHKFYHATQTLKTNMEIAINIATHGLGQVKEILK